ncbi:hypothetical protein [Spirosoma utsteinense]|uniref:Uncharacterized protein n=1 Tax=Spirosoma utsteinense TaxID=2585773 RepID=A0ABR6VZ91_9BACT|nr:hypothetical protein [Spirosoma utsteinense]MBC3784718.1 hypothetical protein [Spirosoma utsteinense]MBC3789528.1 hypothetical protein [Spirosoma utsteinense]
MSFYCYVYLRPLRITIHRAACPYCRQGQGMQRKVTQNKTGFWDGPYPDYERVLDRALTHGKVIQTTPLDCRHCQPAKAGYEAPLPEKENIQPVTDQQEPVAEELKSEFRIKQLDRKHLIEQQSLLTFQNSIHRLMKTRHQTERLALEALANKEEALLALADQQKHQAEELLQARAASYNELLNEQAREKSLLLDLV